MSPRTHTFSTSCFASPSVNESPAVVSSFPVMPEASLLLRMFPLQLNDTLLVFSYIDHVILRAIDPNKSLSSKHFGNKSKKSSETLICLSRHQKQKETQVKKSGKEERSMSIDTADPRCCGREAKVNNFLCLFMTSV